jgi:hypothetical protein
MSYQGSNQVKPSGFPCDLYREQVSYLNAASYTGGTPGDSDDFRFNSTISGTPSRLTHVFDTTAYAAGTVRTDNWAEHVRGKQGVAVDSNNQV